jgi:hypothetical protein
MTLPPWRLPRHHDRTRRSRGQSVAEFAVVLPIMLLILAGAVDLGRVFYAYVAVENAAKEGALYGARHPLCGSASPTCPDPRNVRWIVENEAANLKDRSGASQLTTKAACRTSAGSLVQPINDCVNGDVYVVEVTHSFRLVTPILGDVVGSSLTLGASSEATVVEDAFDPAGLEVLVWVDKAGADNANDITTACVGADPPTSPGYFYAPCQDRSNRYNYLQFQEGDSVKYKVRVRNTGNVDISSLSFSFLVNGSQISKPCSGLQGSLPRKSAPLYCAFERPVVAKDPVGGVADYLLEVIASGQVAGLPTGTTTGSATIKVIPPPLLTVNLRAAPYRLGGDGNGMGGSALYSAGDLTLARTTDGAAALELQNPTGWLKVGVLNQGGPARNFQLVITQDGSAISIPADCKVPTSLAAGGSPGDRFTCILPHTFSDTRTFSFRATATARNAQYLGGDPTVAITTETCTNPMLVVPNLVDTLAPAADGSQKNVDQARSLWQGSGFAGPFSTVPGNAQGRASVLSQTVTAYTCADTNQGIQAATR